MTTTDPTNHPESAEPALLALRASADRLAALVAGVGDAVDQPAYPTEWTIADVVSHLGSGAVIWSRQLDDALAGIPTPDGFNPTVWDEWNAKSPPSKVEDGVTVDAELVARLEALPDGERAGLRVTMGPMELGFDQLVQMRLNEHLVHEWDVAVALDPSATLAADATELVINNLAMIVGFGGTPTGERRTITVTTTEPPRTLAIEIGDRVALTSGDAAAAPGAATLSLPVEAFIRLVYGRLDPAHTPPTVTAHGGALDQLREVFTGV